MCVSSEGDLHPLAGIVGVADADAALVAELDVVVATMAALVLVGLTVTTPVDIVLILMGAGGAGGFGGPGGPGGAGGGGPGLTGPHASCIGAADERRTKLEKASPLRTYLNEGIAMVVYVVEVEIVVENKLKSRDEGREDLDTVRNLDELKIK
jgi:hypothetical protein